MDVSVYIDSDILRAEHTDNDRLLLCYVHKMSERKSKATSGPNQYNATFHFQS